MEVFITLVIIVTAAYYLLWKDIIEPALLERQQRRQQASALPKATTRPPLSLWDRLWGVRYESAAEIVRRPHVLTERQWTRMVNDEPDKYPHVLISGGTGSGKTTIARAILAARAGEVCIMTPKADDYWCLPFATLDSSIDRPFESINATAYALLGELQQRCIAARDTSAGAVQMSAHLLPLTIVIDDAPTLQKNAPHVRTLFERVAQLGRSARVRLIVMSQSTRVKSLKIEGEGDMLDNFLHISITRQRVATLHDGEQSYVLITRNLPKMAARRLSVVPWYMPEAAQDGSEETWAEEGMTTTTTTMTSTQDSTQEPVVVVSPGVTANEQLAIIRAAIEVQAEQGRVNRTEVSRRVFAGKSGGVHSQKVKSVLDRVNIEGAE